MEKLPFQLQQETSQDTALDGWATARAAGGSWQPGIPHPPHSPMLSTVKPLLSCSCLKPQMGKPASGQVWDIDLHCPEQSWSFHPGSKWSCTAGVKVLHGGWGHAAPVPPRRRCLPSVPASAACPWGQQTLTVPTSQSRADFPKRRWLLQGILDQQELFLLLEPSYKLSSFFFPFFPPNSPPPGVFLTQHIWNLFSDQLNLTGESFRPSLPSARLLPEGSADRSREVILHVRLLQYHKLKLVISFFFILKATLFR